MPRRFALLLAIAASAGACAAPTPPVGQSPSPVTQTPATTGSTGCAGDAAAEDLAHARALIDGANTGEQETIAALQDIRFSAAGTLAACQRLQEGADGDALWAATWVYVSGGTDPVPLLPMAGDSDSSVRVIAAAGLTSLGRLEGLDALVALIDVDAGLRGSLPPLTVAQFAAVTLSRYTGAAVADVATGTPEERAATSDAWTSWLRDNLGRLSFNAEQQVWVAR